MTNPLPAEILEQRAAEQRLRLHNSVAEIRSQVKERLDYRKVTRQNLAQATGAAAMFGLMLGYGFGSILFPSARREPRRRRSDKRYY